MQDQTTGQCLVLDQGSLLTRIGFSFEENFKESFYSESLLDQEQKNNFQNLLNLP